MKLKKKGNKGVEEAPAEVEEKPDMKPELSQVKDKNHETLLTVKITNLAFGTKRREVKDFLRPLKPVGIRLPPMKSGFAYVSFKTNNEFKKALNKNKSFLSKYSTQIILIINK